MLSGGLVNGSIRVVLGLAAAYGAYEGIPHFSDVRLTATTLVALSGTLTGFIMTALSLLVAAADRPFMENLRMTGHYQRLMRGLLSSALLWVTVIVVALTAHFVKGEIQRVVLATATGLTIVSLTVFLSAGNKFSKVVLELSRK